MRHIAWLRLNKDGLVWELVHHAISKIHEPYLSTILPSSVSQSSWASQPSWNWINYPGLISVWGGSSTLLQHIKYKINIHSFSSQQLSTMSFQQISFSRLSLDFYRRSCLLGTFPLHYPNTPHLTIVIQYFIPTNHFPAAMSKLLRTSDSDTWGFRISFRLDPALQAALQHILEIS